VTDTRDREWNLGGRLRQWQWVLAIVGAALWTNLQLPATTQRRALIDWKS
jgi:hypothetical protein